MCVCLCMGSGNFVDGVRRWFQRRSSSSSTSSSTVFTNNSTGIDSKFSNNESQVSVSEFGEEEEDLKVIEDFDISGLNLIKVPKRVKFPPTAMDPQKKVSYDLCELGFIWDFDFIEVFGFISVSFVVCCLLDHIMMGQYHF